MFQEQKTKVLITIDVHGKEKTQMPVTALTYSLGTSDIVIIEHWREKGHQKGTE